MGEMRSFFILSALVLLVGWRMWERLPLWLLLLVGLNIAIAGVLAARRALR
ncbi:MAG: hypothetical protein WCC10_13505 [Tumebacillaceae bacterium]